MLLVIPRLDIRNGQVDFGPVPERQYLLTDPVAMSKLWRVQNAKTLLLVDLSPSRNRAVVLDVCRSVDIPIQVDCSFVHNTEYTDYLDCGVYRIVLPSDFGPAAFEALVDSYGSRRLGIRIAGDAPERLVEEYASAGCCRFFVDIPPGSASKKANRIPETTPARGAGFVPGFVAGVVTGFAAVAPGARFTVDGPVVDYASLREAATNQPPAVDSLVIGAALHAGNFPCQSFWCWNQLDKVALDRFTTATVLSPTRNTGHE